MMQYKKWFILLLIPIAVLVIPHISFASTYNATSSLNNGFYDIGSIGLPVGTYYFSCADNPSSVSSPYYGGIGTLTYLGSNNYTFNVPSGVNWSYYDGFNFVTDHISGTARCGGSLVITSGVPYIPTYTYLSITTPNPSSTVYSDFPSWGFTVTGVTSTDDYGYNIHYDTVPITDTSTGGYTDGNTFTASTSTENITTAKSGALVRSDNSLFTNPINLDGYPTTLYYELTLVQEGTGIIQDSTGTINLSIGGTPINASSTNITIVSPSSTSTPVAPFENYIYGVTGVATDTQYTTNQTVTQFINGVPIAPVTQTQIISGINIIANGLTFQNSNELDNYGNATSVPMAVGVTISNGIGEIGQLEYNYTMLPFQSVGANASTGLQTIINPNGTTTLINNIASGNGTASTTIAYNGKSLNAVCSTVNNILDFGQDADYVGCKINNLINQLTFNVTQNLTDSFNGTYNTFTGIFPIDIFADFNNDISIAKAYSNSTSSNPLVLKGQSIADAITGAPTGQYTFGGYTMPILSATTTSWIQTKSGFDYRGVIDNILYALTGLIMLGGAIGVVVIIHKTTAGNA